MIINKNYCSKCKTTEGKLMKYSTHTLLNGDVVQYYHCRPCNNDKHKRWYEDGNQKKALRYNHKYLSTKEY